MTRFQAIVLGVVRDCGPVDPAGVGYHLLVSEGSARGVLSRLEQKGLVGAHYTSVSGRQRHYTITRAGEEAYQLEFGNDEAAEAAADRR